MNDSGKIIPFSDEIPANDPRPLPLIVAAQWHFDLQHYEPTNETPYLYAIQDWIAGLTGDTIRKAQESWRNTNAFNQLRNSTTQLDYEATDGKVYQVPFIDDRGLYLIAQHLRATKKRTALPKILEFLANSGAFVDASRLDPEMAELEAQSRRIEKFNALGHGEVWSGVRNMGVLTRKMFTAEVQRLIGKAMLDEYGGHITNDVYRGVFKTDAKGLREKLKQSTGKKHIANPRDHLGMLQLALLIEAEAACSIELEQYGEDELLPVFFVRELVRKFAGMVGIKAEDMAKALRIDLVTGKRLELPSGDDGKGTA